MKNLTKKELIEKVTILEDQIKQARKEQRERFNKYGFIEDLETEIKRGIENEEINDEDDIRQFISLQIDNAVIYYRDCFEIMMELNVTSFDQFDIGCVATDVVQAAAYALDEYVNEKFDFSEVEALIEERDNKLEETE